MPFPDEVRPVEVVPYRASWPAEFEELARRLATVLDPVAVAIDHIGSTAVPGLQAKDVIDVQVRVAAIDHDAMVARFRQVGFRLRPEPWNHREVTDGLPYEKLVFAPPVGERHANVHVRVVGAANTRCALLFRDFLCAHDDLRDAWGDFKGRLAHAVPDLAGYGQVKAPAWTVLMAGANEWARTTGWEPTAG